MSAVLELPKGGMRRMLRQDLRAVLGIESKAYRFPWGEGIFRDCMRIGYGCRVYEEVGVVLGYRVMSVEAGDCHMLNLCVDPPDQGRGIGRLMLHHLLTEARQLRAGNIFLEVRPSNVAAIGLYRAEGFNEVGTRKGYYPAAWGREDAMIMARTL